MHFGDNASIYVVGDGDTLAVIAAKYGLCMAKDAGTSGANADSDCIDGGRALANVNNLNYAPTAPLPTGMSVSIPVEFSPYNKEYDQTKLVAAMEGKKAPAAKSDDSIGFFKLAGMALIAWGLFGGKAKRKKR